MFGFLKKRPTPADELKAFILQFSDDLFAHSHAWDERDITKQALLYNLVASNLVTLRKFFPHLAIESEGALQTLFDAPLGSEAYDDTLVPYIFDQLRQVRGDRNYTLSVMMYLLAPAAFMQKSEQMGAVL